MVLKHRRESQTDTVLTLQTCLTNLHKTSSGLVLLDTPFSAEPAHPLRLSLSPSDTMGTVFCAQCLPEEHTSIRAPQSLLTSDLGLLLPVSSTVANMLYKHCTALQAVCVLQVWRAGEEGRKRGSYLIPPKGTPLSTRIVNSQANRVAGRHTTHTLLSF